jgi:hypothetical protein
MKIQVNYFELKDISIILHELSNYHLEVKPDYFILKNDNLELYFISENDEYVNPDAKRTNFDILEFDKVYQISEDSGRFEEHKGICIYTPCDEPIGNDLNWLPEFLDNGNYVITSTQLLNFTHPNLFMDIRLIFPFVFHNAGYGFLNYYPNQNKNYLIGGYMSEAYKFHKNHIRYSEFHRLKEISGDWLKDYSNDDYSHREVIHGLPIENKMALCNWKKNYISSYTDYTNCVAFFVSESEVDNDNIFIRLTEKTVKSLLFSKAKCFIIWRGSKKTMDILHKQGYWFLNSEFMKDDVFGSVLETTQYLNDLLIEFSSINSVYSYLLDKYEKNLEVNSKLVDSMINEPSTNFFEKIIQDNL